MELRSDGAVSEYDVRFALALGYLARAPDRSAVWLVELPSIGHAVGRVFGRIRVTFQSLHFKVAGRAWDAHAAVVTCTTESLLPTFVALCSSAATRLNEGPPIDVRRLLAVLSEWEALFRNARTLSPQEELGLWGELQLIKRAVAPAAAVAAWLGPEGAPVDFHGGGLAFEVKTATTSLVHHFSLTQINEPRGKVPAYFISLWAGADPASGLSVPEEVDAIARSLLDPSEFEFKLLKCGYSRAEAACYNKRFVLLEEPYVFPNEHVPTIRRMDAGISEVRFVAKLDSTLSLERREAAKLTSRLGLSQEDSARALPPS